jgi:sRNA-binding regulator protein Hfq
VKRGYLTSVEENKRKQQFQNAVKTKPTTLGLFQNFIDKTVVITTTTGDVSGILRDVSQYEILVENKEEKVIIPKHAILRVLVAMGTK